jgi:hypothetical protein
MAVTVSWTDRGGPDVSMILLEFSERARGAVAFA